MTEELHNDVGHGKNTYPPSKGVPGLPEFEFNSAVAKETKRLLQGKVKTYEAQPFNGNDVDLDTRTDRYNARYARNKKAIGISDHANANGKKSVRGFGVFYWHSSPEAKKLAQIILDEYKKEFPDRKEYPIWGDGLFPSKPGTWTDLHMCRETAGIFVLVEWEFMTNPDALKLLKSNDYRKRCALVKAKAVCRWYGIKFEEGSKVAASSKGSTYTIKKGDTFWGIEEKLNLKHGTLEKLNPKVNPKDLKPGHKIKIDEEPSRVMIKTYWYRDGSAGLAEVEDLLKKRGWHYERIKEEK